MRSKDPIARFGERLRELGVWTDEDESDARRSMHTQVKEAIARAEKFPHPDVRSLFEDVYAEQTPNLRAEADELSEEIGGY